jgi:hypothetical protein
VAATVRPAVNTQGNQVVSTIGVWRESLCCMVLSRLARLDIEKI